MSAAMANWLRHIREAVNPRSQYQERGKAEPQRASSILLGMMLVMFAVVLIAKALSYLFVAA